MKYKISNAYAVINGEEIQVGVALGQEDLPESPFTTGYVTNSEYEQGLKEFRYGKARIGDLVYHVVARFENFIKQVREEFDKVGLAYTEEKIWLSGKEILSDNGFEG